jgi:hypothetical protein
MRVRHLSTNEMHYFVLNRTNKLKGPFLKSLDELRNNIYLKRNQVTQDHEKISNQHYIYQKFKIPVMWFENNLVYCEYESNLTRHYVKNIFLKYLTECGYSQVSIHMISKLYLDDINFKKYDEILHISAKEFEEIKRRLSSALFKPDDYFKYEKYIFVNHIMKENIHQTILSKIFDSFYANKNQRKKLDNIYIEKHKTIVEIHNREIFEKQYKEFYENTAKRLEIINWLNKMLNIKHSTQLLIISRNCLEDKYNEIMSRRDEIYETFNLIDQSKDKKDILVRAVNIINRVYKSWCGAELKSTGRKRKMTNGVTEECNTYILSYKIVNDTFDIFDLYKDATPLNININFNDVDIKNFLGIPQLKYYEENIDLPIITNFNIISPIQDLKSEIKTNLNIISPIQDLKSEIKTNFNIISPLKDEKSPITPVFNIISPISPPGSQIVPVFNITSPNTTTLNIISPPKEENPSITPVFNVISPPKEEKPVITPRFNIISSF